MKHNQSLSQVERAKRRISARVILSAFILCCAAITISGHIVSGASAHLATQSTITDRCSNSVAVPDPEPAGLVADCNVLLAAKDTLRGTTRTMSVRPFCSWAWLLPPPATHLRSTHAQRLSPAADSPPNLPEAVSAPLSKDDRSLHRQWQNVMSAKRYVNVLNHTPNYRI